MPSAVMYESREGTHSKETGFDVTDCLFQKLCLLCPNIQGITSAVFTGGYYGMRELGRGTTIRITHRRRP